MKPIRVCTLINDRSWWLSEGSVSAPILFSGPWVKENCVLPPEGGRLPAAVGHLRRMVLLSRSQHYLPWHIYRCTLSYCASPGFFFPPPLACGYRSPPVIHHAVYCYPLWFAAVWTRCCLVAFNPLKGWKMQFMWRMALYKKAKSYCASCLSWADFPVSTPTLTKRLMNWEVHFGGFKLTCLLGNASSFQWSLTVWRVQLLVSPFCTSNSILCHKSRECETSIEEGHSSLWHFKCLERYSLERFFLF